MPGDRAPPQISGPSGVGFRSWSQVSHTSTPKGGHYKLVLAAPGQRVRLSGALACWVCCCAPFCWSPRPWGWGNGVLVCRRARASTPAQRYPSSGPWRLPCLAHERRQASERTSTSACQSWAMTSRRCRASQHTVTPSHQPRGRGGFIVQGAPAQHTSQNRRVCAPYIGPHGERWLLLSHNVNLPGDNT